jgi:hypothetical protein
MPGTPDTISPSSYLIVGTMIPIGSMSVLQRASQMTDKQLLGAALEVT